MTHAGYTQEERDALGITDGLVRISVGCEDAADLVADLEQALAAGWIGHGARLEHAGPRDAVRTAVRTAVLRTLRPARRGTARGRPRSAGPRAPGTS